MGDADSSLPLWLAFLSLKEQATRDWLTGLHNRRYFEETLSDHIAVARRYERDLSLVLFDIDRFKTINDTHGHETGDNALRTFADILRSTARQADIVCRYGGDEFAVILPETSLVNARHFAKRVQSALRDNGDVVPPVITVTAGIAALPSDNLTGEADTELLQSKRAP